jgi:hypothetical protein
LTPESLGKNRQALSRNLRASRALIAPAKLTRNAGARQRPNTRDTPQNKKPQKTCKKSKKHAKFSYGQKRGQKGRQKMSNLQDTARELMALSESYGLKPELTELQDRIHIQHLRASGSFCSVISLTPQGRVSVYHWETVSGKDYRVTAADLAQCFERYARRAKRQVTA